MVRRSEKSKIISNALLNSIMVYRQMGGVVPRLYQKFKFDYVLKDLVHILKTILYFTDRHFTDWSVEQSICKI